MAASSPTLTKKISYALASALLGAWAFVKVNSISGPTFEPIIEACTNSDYATAEEFASKTGYHVYEPKAGLGIFNVLVCLITQFLLELRETPPAGILTWGAIVVVSNAAAIYNVIEPGRRDVKKLHLISFPIVTGLFYQIIGISVAFPLMTVPAYIFGRGTKGPISSFRGNTLLPLILPGMILAFIVFTVDTDSYLWTLSAGILGGPIIVFLGAVNWLDESPPITKESIDNGLKAVNRSFNILIVLSIMIWYGLVYIACQSYDSFASLWSGIWVEANASVGFMTVDSIVLYIAVLLCLAFQNEMKALKALVLTLVVGPGAAPLMVMKELEEIKLTSVDIEKKES